MFVIGSRAVGGEWAICDALLHFYEVWDAFFTRSQT